MTILGVPLEEDPRALGPSFGGLRVTSGTQPTLPPVWHDLWALGPPVAEKVIRAALIYLFLIAALRILGKREIAQANTLDFLVLLLVANAVQNGIIGNDNSVSGAVVGALALFAINYTFKGLAYRYPWADRVFEGSPSYLIREGQLVTATMRREQISKPE